MLKINIFIGTVYGNATFVAEQVLELLQMLGHQAQICQTPKVEQVTDCDAVLFISSTTGQGDIPPELEQFYLQLNDQFPLLDKKPFGVIALGDSSYGETYCGAGRKLFELLQELQGKAVKPLLEIDACETLEPEKVAIPWVKEWLARV
ncbi:flavodoxin [Neptunicella marina]|uniref:Flavodoxin n=1 Tax=Neptunicella marina TaxID=2125989 RepID=A0A8J6IS77_9ALTE|nr:flavodoxin [Neptunicella marina]MBC3764897.1 flavodoxin [Neptunicella marina]